MDTIETIRRPVVRRGDVIGHATTERGAKAVAVRCLGRPGPTERVTARLAELLDEDAMVAAHERGDVYRGPLAWSVGFQHRG